MIGKLNALLEKYDKVSILTHRNPDADTLGTGLGIYTLLKNTGKQVEICNPSKNLPKHLDFLPHFAKIKSQVDFDNSLIITCDSSSIDLLVFDLSLREVVNIDHHQSNTNYGVLNVVDSSCVSASMVAYKLLKDNFKVTGDVAICFYVALVTDTQNFTTLNVNHYVFDVASELISLGINLKVVNKNLMQRKSLSSLRVLSATLDTLELFEDAQIASIVLSQDILKKTGATLSDSVGLIDHVIGLASVNIAILIIEFDSYLHVTFRSNFADVASLAVHFGGGGHRMASGFRSEELDIGFVLKQIKQEIKQRGLINGT